MSDEKKELDVDLKDVILENIKSKRKMPDEYRFFSINQLSKITGKDRQTIMKRISEMSPVREDARGKYYDGWEALPLIYAGDNKGAMVNKIDQADYEIKREKLKTARYENLKLAGQLIDIDTVSKVVEREYTYIKTRLDSIASNLATKVALETNPGKCFDLINNEVQTAKEELVSDQKYREQSEEMDKVKTDEPLPE